jgi:hypothetical protein
MCEMFGWLHVERFQGGSWNLVDRTRQVVVTLYIGGGTSAGGQTTQQPTRLLILFSLRCRFSTLLSLRVSCSRSRESGVFEPTLTFWWPAQVPTNQVSGKCFAHVSSGSSPSLVEITVSNSSFLVYCDDNFMVRSVVGSSFMH